MRSSPFVILSITGHIAAVATFVWLVNARETSNEKVEVASNQPVTETVPTASPVPAVEPAVPAPVAASTPVATPKPVVTEAPPTQVKKPKASVAALLKRQPKTNAEIQAKAVAAIASGKVETKAEEKVEKEDTDASTEATATEARAEDPAPVGYSEQTPEEEKTEDNSPKPGATKQDAVSYLDLKPSSGNKPPAYPADARREHRQGELELVYHVTHEGLVEDISVAKTSGHSDLDEAAVEAVSKYKFAPGQEAWARQPIEFSLKGPDEDVVPSKVPAESTQADVE